MGKVQIGSAKVLILTPVKNAVGLAGKYLENLSKLSYPEHLLSVGILESDSEDGSDLVFRQVIANLATKFRRAGFWKKDFGFSIPPDVPRWADEIQPKRREILAKSRNHLLIHALDDEDWVLWLDVDVIEYPQDLIQQLLSYSKDILHPHCVLKYGGSTFDRNGWSDHGNRCMDDMRFDGSVVPLHAVGGTVLFIRADVHRDGLIFPPFFYGNKNSLARTHAEFGTGCRRFGEIETEGLGIMANDMGLSCWGLPHLEIIHQNR